MTPNQPIFRSKLRFFRRNSDFFLNYLGPSPLLDTHIRISIKSQKKYIFGRDLWTSLFDENCEIF